MMYPWPRARSLIHGIFTLADGGPSVNPGEVMSVTALSADPVDVVSSIGIDAGGWVVAVKLKGISDTVGTVDASKLSVVVRDPGFDTSGNPTTVTRTLYGVAHLRRQFPNGASKMISASGGDVEILVTLSDWIYSGSTILSASIGTGFYPSSVASSAPIVVNSSTLPYPEPVFAWINPQNERSGTTHDVEAVVFHRHARNGQQVAAVSYEVTDGTNTSTTLVGTTQLSTRVQNGNIPEVWKGTLDMSAMAQATTCQVNVKFYPWIGTEFNMDSVAAAWPTPQPMAKLRVFCDKTGGYGGAIAYVKVGAVGGTVSDVAATAKAAPFPTPAAALTAVRAWNNTNKGHNDLGGATVRFMDDGAGGAQNHSLSGDTVNAPGACWCILEKDPETTADVSITVTAQSRFASLSHWRNLKNIIGAVTHNWLGYNELGSMICVENCVVDNTQNRNGIGWYDYKYIINMQVSGSTLPVNSLPSATAAVVSLIGVTGSAVNGQARTTIGCNMPTYSIEPGQTTQLVGGMVAYNNRVKNAFVRYTSTPYVLPRGVANVQNLYEKFLDASAICMNFFADGDTTQVRNYIDFYNTSVGERSSRMYNDVVATKITPAGCVKQGVSKFSIYDNFNIKGDYFNGGNGQGSVGGFSYSYGVGNDGCVSLFGMVQRFATQAPVNGATDSYLGNAWLPTSEYNLFRTSLGFTQAQIMDMFVNYTVAPRGTPAVGGDYKPLPSAAHLINRVPVNQAGLRYDLSGSLRKNDGTGAAGAYEA